MRVSNWGPCQANLIHNRCLRKWGGPTTQTKPTALLNLTQAVVWGKRSDIRVVRWRAIYICPAWAVAWTAPDMTTSARLNTREYTNEREWEKLEARRSKYESSQIHRSSIKVCSDGMGLNVVFHMGTRSEIKASPRSESIRKKGREEVKRHDISFMAYE